MTNYATSKTSYIVLLNVIKQLHALLSQQSSDKEVYSKSNRA